MTSSADATPGTLVASMSFRQMAGRSLNWLRYLANRSSRRSRFVPLTPPFLARQLLYDRSTRKVLRVRIRNEIDDQVLHAIFLKCDCEFPFSRAADLQKFYETQVVAGLTPLIIDCGANSGMATRYFRETFPAAHIVAVEPDTENLRLAESNNDGGNVSFKLAGIGCEPGRADIVNKTDANWAYRTEVRTAGSVEIVSVADILAAHSTMIPFIIKVDIEGFESNLFSKDTGWIERFPMLLIELHDWMLPRAGCSRNFLRAVSQLDRDFIHRGENVFSVSNSLV